MVDLCIVQSDPVQSCYLLFQTKGVPDKYLS